ncbi:YciI family protein [Nocardia altamirensis]|uniref:YciI family protein n=1 Tax=Nocardia altamirensis TaxID=472158 RepID=UPI000840640F|nr:YciI family protein [Nocardia altamirensis]
MPIFAVHYSYSEATVPGRDTYRPEHRAWLGDHLAAGTLLSSGPFADGSGALLVFQTEDADALSALLADDPFAREKLIDHVAVLEWVPVLGAFAS